MKPRWTIGICLAAGIAWVGAGCGHQSTAPIQDQVDFSDPRFFSAAGSIPSAGAPDSATPVVYVNGTAITHGDVRRESAIYLAFSRALRPPEQFPRLATQIMDQSLESLVVEKLLTEDLASDEFEVTTEEIDKEIEGLRAPFRDESTWASFVQSTGLTEAETREDLRDRIRLEKLIRARMGDVPEPTEEEVREVYASNSDQFVQPELAEMRNILLKSPADGPPEQRQEAIEKANMLRSSLLEGKDFGELARRHSDDERSGAQGGNLGRVARQQLPPEIAVAVFTQELGVVGAPVENEIGVHLLLVTSRTPERQLEFEEVREAIEARLKAQAFARVRQSYIASVMKTGTVEPATPAPTEDASPTP